MTSERRKGGSLVFCEGRIERPAPCCVRGERSDSPVFFKEWRNPSLFCEGRMGDLSVISEGKKEGIPLFCEGRERGDPLRSPR